MPLDHTNMMILNFLKESYSKADERCTNWFMKNQAKLEKMAELPEKFRGIRPTEVMKPSIEMGISTFITQLPSAAVHRRKKALRDGIIQGKSQMKDTWTQPEPTMIPMDPAVQNIIYEPLPNGGRREYLAKRNHVKPEDKYNFCMTGNGTYGWRIRDSRQARLLVSFGRYFAFEHDLRSRTGPHPDPAYYQEPPEAPYSKCSH